MRTISLIIIMQFVAILIFAQSTDTFKDDRDGQIYKIVTIGEQTWMAQNMNYKTDNSYYYSTNEENGKIYGRLYTIEAALNVCPSGWHLPSAKEWNQLSLIVGHNNFLLKEKGTTHWYDKNPSTDKYNFCALPGGYLWGTYQGLGKEANFWTSEKKDNYSYYYVTMKYSNSIMTFDKEMNYGKSGFSVRCIKD